MNRLNILFITLVLSFISYETNAQNLEKLSISGSHSLKDTTAPKLIKEEKSAFVAGTLSLIGPGLAFGQIYNGQMDKFSSHICISAACFMGVYITAIISTHTHGSGSAQAVVLIGAAFIYLGNWVWSIIDAANSADNINRQNAMKKKHSDILNKLRFGLTLNKNKQFNLKFALEL